MRETPETRKARADLVRQLARQHSGLVTDERVLAAVATVPRHLFVEPASLARAYENHALPVRCGQTISQPLVVAAMTQWLLPRPDSRVLEVGTGSGYQTAILAQLVAEVYSIEYHERLHAVASQRLDNLDLQNVCLRRGDGYDGWPEAAPFDGIIVTCRVDAVPPPLIAQLAEGARLVIPVGPDDMQTLHAYTKRRGKLVTGPEMSVRFVPLLRDPPAKTRDIDD